jgi:DNA-binding beta-propeller fold protein YncE
MVTPDFISLTSTIINLNDNTSEKAVYAGAPSLIEKAVYPGNALMTAVTAPGQSVLLAPIATGMMGSGEKYYTADFLGNTISVVDLNTKEIIKQIDLLGVGAGLPIQTPVSPDDKWVVSAHVLGPKITVIDTSTDEIVATLNCDPGCHGVQWGAKDGSDGYYAYVSNKFSNALLVVDPDPNSDGDGSDAVVAGKILLNKQFATDTDDKIIGYDGMGGQGILAMPNVYDGWIDATVAECGATEDPCSQEMVDYLMELSSSQQTAIP